MSIMFLNAGRVLMNWRLPCKVTLYKEEDDPQDCGKNRCMILLSMVGKRYAESLIGRAVESAVRGIGKEQCGFRKDRGCSDHTLVERQLCEKMKDKKNGAFLASMTPKTHMTERTEGPCGKY